MWEPEFLSNRSPFQIRFWSAAFLFLLFFSALDAAVLQRFSGFVLVRPDSRDGRWHRVEQDVELKPNVWFRTSREFSGRLLREGLAPMRLDPSSDYVLDGSGLKIQQQGLWNSLDDFVNRAKDSGANQRESGWWILNPYVESKISREHEFRGKVVRDSFALQPGDRIVLPLESGAQLLLGDGAEVRIEKGSALKVGHERIDLIRGDLFSSIPSADSRLEILTPFFRTSVRGTIFEVSHHQESEVRVFDGVVKVASLHGSRRSRFLQRGQRGVLREGGNQLSVNRFDADRIPEYGLSPSPSKAVGYGSQKNERENRSQRIQRLLTNARKKGFDDLSPDFRKGPQRRDHRTLAKDLESMPETGDDPEFRTLSGKEGSTGMDREFESWYDPMRRDNAQIQEREEGYLEAKEEYNRDKGELDRREERAVGVRASVRREGFEKGQVFRSGQKDQSFRQERELKLLKSFLSRKQLELDRLKRELERNDRERDRVTQKINNIQQRTKSSDDDRLEESLISLRVQKRELDREHSFLVDRRRGLEQSIQQAARKLVRLTDSNARGSVIDQDFQTRSRELLRP